MKYACQYAIARFLPYAETDEFVNVGIVLTCPQTGYFDFKLATDPGRINTFFAGIDTEIFQNVCLSFSKELSRIRTMLTPPTDLALAKHMFAEVIRPRESIMRFSPMRVVLTDDPVTELNGLFEHYITRHTCQISTAAQSIASAAQAA